MEEPLIPENFRAFLVEYHGTQWEIKFLGAAAEPLFAQLLAYVAGYARLTSHNKRIFRQSFETWAVAEKLEQLTLLGEPAAFSKLSKSPGSVGRRGSFSPRRSFICFVL